MTNKKEWIATEEVMYRLDCLLKHLCSTDSYSMTEDEFIDFKKKFRDVVTDIYQNQSHQPPTLKASQLGSQVEKPENSEPGD